MHIVRTTEMGPRALVLALLPTAVAANKGNEVIKFVVIGAAVQGRCGKSRDKLIERANVAHCSGGLPLEAVLLRRRYAVSVMKEAARARRR